MKKIKIKGYRNMLGMTQTELASILGISKQSYYRKEKGYSNFKDNEKIIIKTFFSSFFPEITVDDIFF